jgi:hypothetical protein
VSTKRVARNPFEIRVDERGELDEVFASRARDRRSER